MKTYEINVKEMIAIFYIHLCFMNKYRIQKCIIIDWNVKDITLMIDPRLVLKFQMYYLDIFYRNFNDFESVIISLDLV